MKILFIGDIFGHEGRRACLNEIKQLKEKHEIDLVIANAENTSNGKGITKAHFEELKDAGVDFFTMGNHTWDNKEFYEIVLNNKNIIRPGNVNLQVLNDYAHFSHIIVKNKLKIRVTNLMGASVLGKKFEVISPFLFFNEWLTDNKDSDDADIHLVDFHAESTAEKAAFYRMFDGMVDAILGTHTHVQTNDNQISKKNTAFITDVGLTGAYNSIIGADIKPILNFYKGFESKMYISSAEGNYQFCAVILTIDETAKKIINIEKEFIIEKR